MAFTRKTTPDYWWAGELLEPDEDGKLAETGKVRLKFKRTSHDEMKKYETDQDLLSAVVLGWTGLKDADDKEVPFSKENLEQVINDQFLRINFVRIYFDAFQKARTGN
jgi:hypothetical protein